MVIRRLLIIFIFLFVICFTGVNSANAQFASGIIVYPNVVEMDFTGSDKSFVSSVIQVENPTDKLYRIRAYVQDWTLNEDGGIVFLDKPEQFSLSTGLKFNPREFDLAPGQKQAIRLTAKLPSNTDGEFRSIIFFETVNPKQEILKNSQGKINVNVSFKTRLGVAVYAYKGDVSRNALLSDLKYEKLDNRSYLTTTLKNEGNIHCNVEGEIVLTSKTDNSSVKTALSRYTIMPNHTQKYRILIPEDILKNDNYTAYLRLNYKDVEGKPQILEGKTGFKHVSSVSKIKSELINPNSLKNEKIEKTPENISRPEMNTEIRLED